MAPKDVHLGDDARARLSEGFEFLARIVGATFGPMGGYAIIDKGSGPPHATRASGELADDLVSGNRARNVGVQLLLELARATGAAPASGSATTMLLAAAIVREGARFVAVGYDPTTLRHVLERTAKAVAAELERVARQIRISSFQDAFNDIWYRQARTIGDFARRAGIEELPPSLASIVVQPDEYLPVGLVSDALSSGLTPTQLGAIFEQVGIARRDAREAARARPVEEEVNWPLLDAVAMSAADGADDLARSVVDAVRRVGLNGYIAPETGYGTRHEIEVDDGLRVGATLESHYFSNESGRILAAHRDAYVLVTDQEITNIRDILPVLEEVMKARRPLLIVANRVTGEALATLVVNHRRNVIKVASVYPKGDAAERAGLFEDAAVATGARLITKAVGAQLRSTTLADLGRATRVEASESHVVLVSPPDTRQAVEAHVGALQHRLSNAETDAERERLRERISRIALKLARIGVGGRTVRESQENLRRCERIIRAVRLAIDKGAVPGGGAALVRASRAADYLDTGSDAQRVGVAALLKALHGPLVRVIGRQDVEPGEVIKALAAADTDVVYDVVSREFGPLSEKPIADPVAALQQSLMAAASLAGLVLMTEVMISERQRPVRSTEGT